MPLPAHLEPKTVEINAVDFEGAGSVPRIRFRAPSVVPVVIDNTLVVPKDIDVVIDGTTLVDLPPCNDPNAAEPFLYDAILLGPDGAAYTRRILIPYDASEPVNLAELWAATPSPPDDNLVTIGAVAALVAYYLGLNPIQNDAIDDRIAIATILAAQISGILADANIPAGIARDLEVTAAIAAALLSLNGDNILTGTVADARIAATIARDSEVTAAVAAAIAALSTVYVALTGPQSIAGAKTFSSLATFSAGISATTVATGPWVLLDDGAAAYQNGFAAYSGSAAYTPAAQITNGTAGPMAELCGRITGSSWTDGLTILDNLPSQFRPSKNVFLVVSSEVGNDDNGKIEITPAGLIINRSSFPNTDISLDGQRYRLT